LLFRNDWRVLGRVVGPRHFIRKKTKYFNLKKISFKVRIKERTS